MIIIPLRPGELLASNPLTRTHAVCDAAFAELLTDAAGERAADWWCRAVDATRSPVAEGLLGDPTGVDRGTSLMDAPAINRASALALALKLRLIVADADTHSDFLDGSRRTVVDLTHRGTVHDVVAEDVLLRQRRRDLDACWSEQTFTGDCREPGEGLYRDVQWVVRHRALRWRRPRWPASARLRLWPRALQPPARRKRSSGPRARHQRKPSRNRRATRNRGWIERRHSIPPAASTPTPGSSRSEIPGSTSCCAATC